MRARARCARYVHESCGAGREAHCAAAAGFEVEDSAPASVLETPPGDAAVCCCGCCRALRPVPVGELDADASVALNSVGVSVICACICA